MLIISFVGRLLVAYCAFSAVLVSAYAYSNSSLQIILRTVPGEHPQCCLHAIPLTGNAVTHCLARANPVAVQSVQAALAMVIATSTVPLPIPSAVRFVLFRQRPLTLVDADG